MKKAKEAAMVAPVKRAVGRPRGSKTFREGPPPPSKRMRDLMGGCYSEEEWVRRFKQLPPTEQFRLRGMQEPRVWEEQPTGDFILKIVGLGDGNTCPSCGWTQDPEAYRKIIIEKHRAANANSEDKDGRRGRSWREDARAQGESVSAEAPSPKAERSPGVDDVPPEVERIPLRDPAGRKISFGPPDPPPLPFGSIIIP
jgi:hypothetical protein